jgi:hypothetical protein
LKQNRFYVTVAAHYRLCGGWRVPQQGRGQLDYGNVSYDVKGTVTFARVFGRRNIGKGFALPFSQASTFVNSKDTGNI